MNYYRILLLSTVSSFLDILERDFFLAFLSSKSKTTRKTEAYRTTGLKYENMVVDTSLKVKIVNSSPVLGQQSE